METIEAAPQGVVTEDVAILPDQQADVTLSVSEQDAIVRVAHENDELPEVHGVNAGERRAWGQPRAERQLDRD